MSAVRRTIAAVIAAAVLVVSASVSATAATQEPPELTCIPAPVTTTNLSVQLTFAHGGTALSSATGTLSASWDGGDTWEGGLPALNVAAGSSGNATTLLSLFDGRPAWPVLIKWESDLGTATCYAEHHPADASVSAPDVVAYGERVAFVAQFRMPTVPLTSTLVTDVYLDDGVSRLYLGSSRVTTWGQIALFTSSVPHTGFVEFELYDDATDPDHEHPWNVSDGVWLRVSHATPLFEYTKTVVVGQRVKMRFWYGDPSDYYHVEIQRFNGSMWVKTGTEGVALETTSADISFAPAASGTYRVYYWSANKAYDPHWKTFTVTVVPKVALSAVSSVKKGTNVTFTVKHPLTSSGTGKLQYYSKGAWKTAKTFALSSTRTTKVTYKISSTLKWRAVVGTSVSASKTVTAK